MGCLVLTLLVGGIERTWWGLWPLGLIPIVYVLNVMSYRHLGYWLGTHYFRTRRGWLSRAGHVVPIRNAQAIVIRQNPWDRRHGVATLCVDTAGQMNTGGGPQISNVHSDEAWKLAWHLAREAARMRYRW
jgi:putative membrane protein